MRDVAHRAEVSVSTVSNVLNHPRTVAPATFARVIRAINELGYVPNGSARQLRLGRGNVIGLVVIDLGNPFFTDVACGVDDAAMAAGMGVILCNSDKSSVREASYLDLLQSQRVSGVLITPIGDPTQRLLRLRENGILAVLLDRRSPYPDLCSVSVDDERGGALAISHLLDVGHRRIAFVGGPFHLEQVRQRYRGGLRALREAGLDEDCLVPINTTEENVPAVQAGRDAASRILGIPSSSRPTAAFCASDLLALGVLQGLTQRGAHVPGEVAIVGYDDIEFAAAAAVPLSSVRRPRRQLGHVAAGLLLEEAKDSRRHEHRQVVLPPELVVRESSPPRP